MTVYVNDEIIEEVKEAGDIVEFISSYVNLKKSGSNYMGLCPFHGEKTPSFSVNAEKQYYKCFGCGEGGDIIEFCMKKENLDFLDSVKFLADRYNIQLSERIVNTEEDQRKERFYEMNRDAARYFYSNLIKNNNVISYLNKRGIEKNIINRFGLGYSKDSWDGLLKYLKEKKYTEEELEENGLIVKRQNKSGYYDRFRNRLMFPIIDYKGRVIGFGGRVLDDTLPKYLNSKDSYVFDKGHNLYGINIVNKKSDRENIILVEGYMDVIALSKYGIDYSVASLGTSLTESQGKMLKRYGKNVYICYDGDSAGLKATLRAIEILVKIDVKPRVIVLPDKLDPDDYINKFGLLEFNRKIQNSLNYMDFRIDLIKREYNLEEPEDIIDFTIEISELISQLDSAVEQDVYINKIAQDTHVSKKAIEEEVKKFANRNRSDYNGKVYVNKEKNTNSTRDREKVNLYSDSNLGIKKLRKGTLKAEENLLIIMLEDKEYFNIITNNIDVKYFSIENQELLKIISDEYLNNELIKKEALLESSAIDKEKIDRLLRMKYQYDATEIDIVIKDLIKTIEYNFLCTKRDELISGIAELDKLEHKSSEDLELFQNLMVELMELNMKIKEIRQD